MQYLKQLIIKRKNVVCYKEEILEIDEEKTKILKKTKTKIHYNFNRF